jgi:molecular chaperone GrpE
MDEQEDKKVNTKKAVSEYQQAEESGKPAHKAHAEAKTKAEAANQQVMETLKGDLEKAKQEATVNLDGWQRERAEFSNYKRRIERENTQLRNTITGDVIKKYLVIMDDLALALKNRPNCGEGSDWADGIELIVRKLQSVLDGEGIECINENKVQFDPNLHEAISNEENPEFASGEIIEVVRQGYKLGDRILRPAMVRVAR